MERLTKWVDCSGARYGECIDGHCGQYDCNNCWHFANMMTKLAMYEDSGLTPEEVVKMRSEHANCFEVQEGDSNEAQGNDD